MTPPTYPAIDQSLDRLPHAAANYRLLVLNYLLSGDTLKKGGCAHPFGPRTFLLFIGETGMTTNQLRRELVESMAKIRGATKC